MYESINCSALPPRITTNSTQPQNLPQIHRHPTKSPRIQPAEKQNAPNRPSQIATHNLSINQTAALVGVAGDLSIDGGAYVGGDCLKTQILTNLTATGGV